MTRDGRGKNLKPGSSEHNAEHQFQPGQSGNPGGRTKAEMAARRLVTDMILRSTDNCARLVELLVRVAFGEEDGMTDPRSRSFAIRELLDRSVGRAPLDVAVALGASALTPEQIAALDALKMSPFARRQRIAELKAAPEPTVEPPADPDPDGSVH